MTVIKIYPTPLTPWVASKVKYLNFAITQSVGVAHLVFFTKILYADIGTIKMKHIKCEFTYQMSPTPGVDFRGGAESKIQFYVVYQIKENATCSNMVANILVISESKPEAAHETTLFSNEVSNCKYSEFKAAIIIRGPRALDKPAHCVKYENI